MFVLYFFGNTLFTPLELFAGCLIKKTFSISKNIPDILKVSLPELLEDLQPEYIFRDVDWKFFNYSLSAK